MDAEIIAAEQRGRRAIAADDFFAGMMGTALAEDELLREARVPLLAPDTRFGFYEFSRRAGDYAMAMALVDLSPGRTESSSSRASALAAPKDARAGLRSRSTFSPAESPATKSSAPRRIAAAAAIEPMEDVHADAEFRLDLVRAVTRRALERTIA